MKAFAEGQGSAHKGVRPTFLLNSGLEAALTDWLWLDFSLGVEKAGADRSTTVSSFKLKTGIPGIG
jgi:hypothetical protein